MKLRIKYIFRLLLVLFLVGQGKVYGQQEEPEKEGEVENAEIIITKDRQLTLPNSDKIFEKSRIINNAFTPDLRPNIFKPYSYVPQKANPNFKAVAPKQPRREQLYANYIKAGLGNFQSVLFQTQLFLVAEENKIIAIDIDHLSFGKGATGDSDSKSSKSGAGISSRFIGKKMVFSTGINFKSIRENFYGHGTLPATVDFISAKQKFSVFELRTALEDINLKDKWDYNIGFNYHNVRDNFNASEFQIGTTVELLYDGKIGLELDTRSAKYEDLTDLNRSYLRLVPTYQFELSTVQIKVGLSLNYHNDSTTAIDRSKVFPYLEATYPFSENIELYGLIDAGFKSDNYKDIILNNPYVNQQLAVQSEERSFDFKIGLRSRPLEKLSLKGYLNVSSVKNLAVFINSAIYNSKFDIAYLPEPTKIVAFNLSSDYQISDRHQLGLSFENINYSNDLTTSFHLPSITIDFNGSHKIGNKFILNWKYHTMRGISSINGDTGEKESISVQNFNLSGNYSVKEKLNLFLDLDNIFNHSNFRYYNYERRGFQLKIGAFYRF